MTFSRLCPKSRIGGCSIRRAQIDDSPRLWKQCEEIEFRRKGGRIAFPGFVREIGRRILVMMWSQAIWVTSVAAWAVLLAVGFTGFVPL